jgi:hypothetical protein
MAQLGARAENVYSQPDKLEDDPHRGVGKFRIAIEEILSQLRFHTDEGLDFIFRQALKQLLVLLGELVTGTDQTRVHKALYRTRTLHNPLLEVSSRLPLLSDLDRPNKNSSRIRAVARGSQRGANGTTPLGQVQATGNEQCLRMRQHLERARLQRDLSLFGHQL